MLRLVIEHAPCPQRVGEMRLEAGELSIGRGADCDWQIDDPDMFVSRRHCIVSGGEGGWRVIDASRGGLFLDGSESPLGAGNSAVLAQGTRLRLGDVVLRAEIEGREPLRAPPALREAALAVDDFFASPRAVTPEPPPRPKDLPGPFEAVERAPAPPPQDDFGFGWALPAQARPPPAEARATEGQDPFFRPGTATGTPSPEASPAPPQARSAPRELALSEDALSEAFFRGLGLPSEGFDAAGMEAMGRRFRLLAEGLVLLLRARAREKGAARVPQSVIGASEVNPLKFLVTLDEAVAALVTPRGPGYLGPEASIEGAFRDLTDHQLRNWIAVQAALRRMIDRFDPARFEAESEREGRMAQLLAGGRSARLWQLYLDRYEELARAAEDRFLGEVGADFREAYEGPERRENG
ncbi:type VI secretion system-associated FHA domain protein TagH [Cereibacter sphaeroides]|uniref:Type VI secretion system-associated FHA domain protein TagH n=1 Tax=Cereibacter sphaeroides TaxID=1063 RepID=A0AAX1UM72_CERSP|nr:type VI secretion system-associated FHA domain protein TagH [Cereibacter sphaeroides]RHZ95420.1 type VI secretion system-associated FHA domain protein TagH [Cereibacter sphaeroides]